MKLKLIAPARQEAIRGSQMGRSLAPPLNLAIVASLTPPHWEVSLADENIDPIDFEERVDMVGITAVTNTAPRAYEIADTFRAKGTTVVLGGIHPSLLPEEAGQHAEAVVMGEAEGTWPTLVQDLENGRLQKTYHNRERPSLAGFPWPRRDLFAKKGYILRSTIPTTRGCPFACTFCTVTSFFGKTYRFRPLDEVLLEIRSFDNNKLIFFVDDNIMGNPQRAKELFRRLIPYNIRWIGQGSITMAGDSELLRLAAASGCKGIFVGIESLSPASLASVGKKFNRAEDYEQAIKRIHSYGIAIAGSFIFGFDHDDEGVFERTVEFVKRNKIETPQYGILTPFPGTVLYEDMAQQGRITTRDWAKYRLDNVVFEPKLMSAGRLKEGHDWAWKESFTLPSIWHRVGIFRPQWLALWGANMNFRIIWHRKAWA